MQKNLLMQKNFDESSQCLSQPMSPWNDQRQLNEVNYNKTFSFVKPIQYGQ